ncbi:hypothetical protein OAL30_01505 [Akkermansiaceae bacterium]|nr:hypothetical protein [Akkermansiaceae bacterium]
MKKLSLALSLAFGTIAFAEVPALINYQGRLVDGVGNPIVGKKEFKLDIYDSQTEGTLIYQETLPDITLDEDGAYSFQFGAGVSRTGTSQLIATGDGETMLFQTPLEQTPFGPITVTDGTNSFTQGDVATGEEPFTFLYVRGANRINLVCNDPPATGVSFTATYRYNEAGIVGALGTAAEHWMEVTIGGEKQEPRQRLVAVPFALKAGSLVESPKRKLVKLDIYSQGYTVPPNNYTFEGNIQNGKMIFEVPQSASALKKVSVRSIWPITFRVVEFDYAGSRRGAYVTNLSYEASDLRQGATIRDFPLDLNLNHSLTNKFFIEIVSENNTGNNLGKVMLNAPLIVEYEE